jgi:hypothetical protein
METNKPKSSELKKFEKELKEQYYVVQESRKVLIKNVINELNTNKINQAEAEKKMLTLINMVEYQVYQSFSKETTK